MSWWALAAIFGTIFSIPLASRLSKNALRASEHIVLVISEEQKQKRQQRLLELQRDIERLQLEQSEVNALVNLDDIQFERAFQRLIDNHSDGE